MAVAVLVRFSGGDREKFIANAKKGQVHIRETWSRIAGRANLRWPACRPMGPTARHVDWERFGKSAQVLTSDPTAQKMLAEMMATFNLEDRTIIAGIDL
jgi:hypothetical protein